MKKTLRNILISATILTALTAMPSYAQTLSEIQSADVIKVESFKDYNLSLKESEKGINTYTGTKNNLRINVTADDKQVHKMILIYDNNIGSDERKTLTLEILDLSNKLFPEKLPSLAEAEAKLFDELDDLDDERDDKIFTINQLRFEVNVVNNLVNIRVAAI